MSRIGVVLAILMLPGMVFAHATPVEMSPDSGENVIEAKEITIRFSERLEQGSSRIRVANENGENVEKGVAQVGEDLRVLSVPIEATEGVYTVSWSVVSQDDGHFTKGAYAFAVGSSTVANASDSSVVKLTSWKETAAIFVEFIGNSILWAFLVLLIFAIRPIIPGFADSTRRIRTVFDILVSLAAVSGIAGALWQIFIKGSELAILHSEPFTEGMHLYLHTAAGEASLYRMAAIAVFGVAYAIFRARLYEQGTTWRDGILLTCLLVFAYFRATISHATANPFFPEFSIFVNVIHLIDKDLWFGILIVLIALALAMLHDILRAIIPRAFSILALNLALISLTASYIVWLHLRDFGNLTTTEWGENFLKLATAAALLVAVRVYHVLSLKRKATVFAKWAPLSLAMEMGAAGLVVFFSSLVIITSPPAHDAQPHAFTHAEQGIVIRLERSPFEDASMLLVVKGEHEKPIVRIGEGEGALLAALAERFQGGYVFPLALVQRGAAIEIIVPRKGGYDVHTTFKASEEDFAIPEGHGRTFDLFTAIVIALASASFIFALFLEFLGKRAPEPNMINSRNTIAFVKAGLVGMLVLGFFAVRFTSSVFANDFKALCAADNNMWHMMQPMKAGASVSKTPREGCMLSSGTYHIADKREYEYLRSLGPADVAFGSAPAHPQPGEKTALSFKLTETDGSPAKLSIEHEKILHVIIIGADMDYFAHVHADDERALSQSDINSSTFSINHAFPKTGAYIVAVDYLHGLVHESRQFKFEVGSAVTHEVKTFTSPGKFGGYDVEFEYIPPIVGDVSTVKYTIRKNGKPATDLVPYLSAAMHVAIIKNDLSEFIHTHGEVHPAGYVAPTTLKGHQHTPPPMKFGPVVEAHVVFPSSGMYTVFGEFKDGAGKVIPTSFTLRVEK